MFFSISKSDFDSIKNIDVDMFPSEEVPDEFFWANQLILSGKDIVHSNYIYVNDNPTKTQALPWILDGNLLLNARSKGCLFIRKVVGFSDKRTKIYFANLIK